MAVATICFIVCHGGPADHFATFAEELVQRGHRVQIYATGPALQKLKERRVEAISFSIGPDAEETQAIELAKRCRGAAVVITDVGHAFDIPLQEAFASRSPEVLRCAYYDNPEPYVPGGYSKVAARVMLAAERVLFANARLAERPLYAAPAEEVSVPLEKRVGLGYYPMAQANQIAERRVFDQAEIRGQLFSRYGLQEQGQQVLVYMGGNNEEYFSKAFPAFLQLLGEAAQQMDLSQRVVLLQQHPGAKGENRDVILLQRWLEQQGREKYLPQVVLSEMSSEDAQVIADGIFYYQTSMGPQFVLAGIPTIQVGHHPYEDLLVKEGLCSVATDAHALVEALRNILQEGEGKDVYEAVRQAVGITADWGDRFEQIIMRDKRMI